MKEEFVVKKQSFTDKLMGKVSFAKKDKRRIEKLTVTDKDIIIEALDTEGCAKKIIIPVSGVVTRINESDLMMEDKMIVIEYINHLGTNKFCAFYPNFVSKKDRQRLIKSLKYIGIVKIDLSIN